MIIIKMKKTSFTIIHILILTTIGYSQSTEIKNPIFEGAGIRGIAYAGAIQALEERGIALNIEKVGGTSAGQTFTVQNENGDLDLMVDGGIFGNSPIHIFDTNEFDSLNNKISIPNFETPGISIDSDPQIKEDPLSRKLAPYPIEGFTDYISAFYIMVIENLNRNNLTWTSHNSFDRIYMINRMCLTT